MVKLIQPDIEEYAVSKTDVHSELLEELLNETYEKMRMPGMITGPLAGRFLKMMVSITGARRILEIGMFTGYSALSMAEGLPADGELITLEVDPDVIAFASRYFARSPHGSKIKVMEGAALDSLERLEGPFDLVFIDADKGNYKRYYDAALPRLRSGGLILVDNVLWSGRVLSPEEESDHAIAEFNDYVSEDDRVEKVLVTIRDGIFMIRKL